MGDASGDVGWSVVVGRTESGAGALGAGEAPAACLPPPEFRAHPASATNASTVASIGTHRQPSRSPMTQCTVARFVPIVGDRVGL
jgi:hypothetical protein